MRSAILILGSIPPILLLRYLGLKYLTSRLRIPIHRRSHRVYLAETTHARFHPVSHSFRYPLFYVGILFDRESIFEAKDVPKWLFGFNRRALFSIRSGDYLEQSGELKLNKQFFGLLEKSVINSSECVEESNAVGHSDRSDWIGRVRDDASISGIRIQPAQCLFLF